MAEGDGAAAGVDDRRGRCFQASTQASDCTAKASLSSTAPTSSQPMPARAQRPVRPPRPGRSRTSGGRWRTRAAAGDPGQRGRDRVVAPPPRSRCSTAEAPSLSGEALPAVMVPSGRNAGLSRARDSTVLSGADALVAGEVDAGDRHDERRRRSRRPTRRRPAGATGRRTRPAAPARSRTARRSCSLHSPEADRPLLGHRRVDQPPAERRRPRGDVAGGEARSRLGQHPRRPGHRLDPAGDARSRRRRSRPSASRPSRRRGWSRRAG